ncbi:sulfatase [Flammeovirga sp. EKP202]|uniref:sulfatase n=1 Tax=Flammeovirga sp. EKP202 TaxID=2770592 RepID=UPI00165F4EF9|nr:sulfatase [Flammeovirga sp. EKP202]MBD0401559.1 sulfatase [Flammeovirga sp. EKP202]
MNKRFFSVIISFLLITPIFSNAQEDKKPNILIINVDDMGWTDVGYMGNDVYHTPNIDQLSKESIIFMNGYAGAANCAPSRACLLTGQTTTRHGIYTVGPSTRGEVFTRKIEPIKNHVHLPKEALTIGNIFKQNGYQTAAFGKWHVSRKAENYGFDYARGTSHQGHPPSYISPYKLTNLEDGPKREYLTDRITDEVIHYLKNERKNEQPFLVYLPYYAVHTPLMAKPGTAKKYKGKKQLDGAPLNPQYAALVENTDWNIGRLLDVLDELKLTDDTIIIFTSDNGGIYSISHQLGLRAGKGSYYEGGLKVPMLFKWKGHWEAGKKVDTKVTQLDFLPTLVEITNSKMPENYIVDGNSIAPLLTGKGKFNDKRSLVYHFPIYLQAYEKGGDDARDALFRTRPGTVVIQGDWKLHYYYEDQKMELYNLVKDPSERHNVADKYSKRANKMYQYLQDWLKERDGKIPTQPNPKYDAEKEQAELQKYL